MTGLGRDFRLDRDERKRYASYLDDPEHLVAVTERSNRQKAGKDPSHRRWSGCEQGAGTAARPQEARGGNSFRVPFFHGNRPRPGVAGRLPRATRGLGSEGPRLVRAAGTPVLPIVDAAAERSVTVGLGRPVPHRRNRMCG